MGVFPSTMALAFVFSYYCHEIKYKELLEIWDQKLTAGTAVGGMAQAGLQAAGCRLQGAGLSHSSGDRMRASLLCPCSEAWASPLSKTQACTSGTRDVFLVKGASTHKKLWSGWHLEEPSAKRGIDHTLSAIPFREGSPHVPIWLWNESFSSGCQDGSAHKSSCSVSLAIWIWLPEPMESCPLTSMYLSQHVSPDLPPHKNNNNKLNNS